jgi:aminoglycoside phosphotransferase (APT) family kinase protein
VTGPARDGCARHPHAAAHAGHCPACLLEHALATAAGPPGTSILTIQLPLGASAATSVWLVRDESSSEGRMFRLKTWRTPAPADFLPRVTELQARLNDWGHPRVPRVVACWLDAAGTPAVLSEFRQGVPVLDAVTSGALDSARAQALLAALLDVLRAAHARGLAHGSIGSGNVIVRSGDEAADLLDFGMHFVISPSPDRASLALIDRERLASLEHSVVDAGRQRSIGAGL